MSSTRRPTHRARPQLETLEGRELLAIAATFLVQKAAQGYNVNAILEKAGAIRIIDYHIGANPGTSPVGDFGKGIGTIVGLGPAPVAAKASDWQVEIKRAVDAAIPKLIKLEPAGKQEAVHFKIIELKANGAVRAVVNVDAVLTQAGLTPAWKAAHIHIRGGVGGIGDIDTLPDDPWAIVPTKP